MSEPVASPAEIYGRLKEGVHFAGYSFERACTHLEWLLEGDRWMLGGQHGDVNEFLASIKLDQFRIVAEQRKRVAQRIKALQPVASERAIAAVLGSSNGTIHRDLAPNGARNPEKTVALADTDVAVAPNGAPPPTADLSGAEAAKMASRVSTKNQRKDERRDQQAVVRLRAGQGELFEQPFLAAAE
jgi:hypothetical protein